MWARTSFLFSFSGAPFSPLLCSEQPKQPFPQSPGAGAVGFGEDIFSFVLIWGCSLFRISRNPGVQKEGSTSTILSTLAGPKESTNILAEGTRFYKCPQGKSSFYASHVFMGSLLFYRNSLLSDQFSDAFNKVLYVLSSGLSAFLWDCWFRYLVHPIARNGNLASYFCIIFLYSFCFLWSFWLPFIFGFEEILMTPSNH